MPAKNVVAVEDRTGRAVTVWIEDGVSAIARGVADSVTTSGARVRLSERPGFAPGAEVDLRLSFDRDAPTVATTARVSWVRAEGPAVEVGLEWTVPAQQREVIEAWLAA